MANERLEPIDWERVRQALVKPVSNGDSAADTTPNLNPVIALMAGRWDV
jgi:hypothetical protein